MNKIFKSQSLAIGLAMFSMFFGAGNIIFPLAVGQFAGDKNLFAISGLILTAAIMPIAGVIAMILFDGNYRQFFGRLGKTPGFLLAFVTITLLGPLGSSPRCIALAYTTLKTSFPGLSIGIFSAISCALIFLLAFKKNHILTILGWVLTPLLLGSLITIIGIGLLTNPETQNIHQSDTNIFLYGLKEGYNTMDLLAAFFISSTIIGILKMRFKENAFSKTYTGTAFRASMIGAFLLSVIYIGFSYLAAMHGNDIATGSKDELLRAIAMRLTGEHAGILVCLTIALACLTTAIALISAFTDFVQKEVFQEKISYEMTLIGALLITFFVSTFEFTGISIFLDPIMQICYPGLIVLTILNIAYQLKNFKPIKLPVFSAFALSVLAYFFF
jgi:branched-chain amino acid:cation transporter, LIVCS family